MPGLKNKAINFVLGWLYAKLLPKIKYVTAVSEYAARQLAKMYHVSSRVIYNGIDLEVFRPCRERPQDGPVFFNVTAYNNLKGRDLLIKYFTRYIARQYPGSRLIAHGIGISSNNIVNLESIPDSELPRTYCQATMYLLTSRWESFGLPILESLATGTPVIALDRDDARRELILRSARGSSSGTGVPCSRPSGRS
ncbi:glycosyltransferase family 4 protein [Acidilobus sp.]|uniref:glycosyltransferase family 4 protein n=1 Tax=Acidilobus sp. TaxID=1872109 RepID=UPI003CFC5176